MSQELPHEPRTDGKGRRYCNAKDDTCRAFAMRESEKCKNHGGASLKGISSPAFKTGKHSKYLTAIPSRLADDYKAARKRDDLLELNNEVALLDTRLLDVLTRVEQGENGAPAALWLALQKAFAEYQAAAALGTPGLLKREQALDEIESLIDRGVADVVAWREVYGILEQRRKLVESERKRAVEQQEVLTSKEAMVLFNALASAVVEHVSDAGIRARIQSDFIRLTGRPDSKPLRLAG